MIIACIKDIMIKKYDNYKIYIHNLSNFDGIFLLKILAELGDIKPIIHHDDLISIGFKFNGYNLTFRNSQQLLISSLANLGKSFGVEVVKSIFPHLFVNESNLNYVGDIPDINFFIKIKEKELNIYQSKFKGNWNLKTQSIKYCEIDCIYLYQINFKFSKGNSLNLSLTRGYENLK